MTWIGSTEWQPSVGITTSVYPAVTLITNNANTWQASQFKNQPITWTTGKRVGMTDTIIDNTSNLLVILGALGTDPNTTPVVSDKYAILQATGTVAAIDYLAAAFVDDVKSLIPDILVVSVSRW